MRYGNGKNNTVLPNYIIIGLPIDILIISITLHGYVCMLRFSLSIEHSHLLDQVFLTNTNIS